MAQIPTQLAETIPESPISPERVAATAASVIVDELQSRPDDRQQILHAVNVELAQEDVVAQDTRRWKPRTGDGKPMTRAEARERIIAAHRTQGGLLQYSTAVEVAQLEARPRSNRAE
ncbi:hypothetical protein KDA14_02155 [Candidatus Saccharibacteria bacterium]|nr:hypothetical protein [Candidatus Saccharibacteria bacterium]